MATVLRSPLWTSSDESGGRDVGAMAPDDFRTGDLPAHVLDRLLGTGVVIAGEVIISLSGVDLVQVKLNALITSVRAEGD